MTPYHPKYVTPIDNLDIQYDLLYKLHNTETI
jgi:hypothetical protein